MQALLASQHALCTPRIRHLRLIDGIKTKAAVSGFAALARGSLVRNRSAVRLALLNYAGRPDRPQLPFALRVDKR